MIALDTRFMDFSSSLRSQSELKFTLLFVKFKTHGNWCLWWKNSVLSLRGRLLNNQFSSFWKIKTLSIASPVPRLKAEGGVLLRKKPSFHLSSFIFHRYDMTRTFFFHFRPACPPILFLRLSFFLVRMTWKQPHLKGGKINKSASSIRFSCEGERSKRKDYILRSSPFSYLHKYELFGAQDSPT